MRAFGMRDKIGYFFGDMGCNLSFQLVSNYMFLFYTQCIGLRTTTWAWIIVVAKCWDAVNDILIGNLIDRKRLHPDSKFKPWILLGGCALVVLTILIFFPWVKGLPYAAKIVWCLVSYSLWSVAYTMVNVPYGSLHSVITNDPKERTTLSTFRALGAVPPNLLTILLPQIVYLTDQQTNQQTLSANRLFLVAFICSLIAVGVFYAMTKMVTERVAYTDTKEKTNTASTVRSYFQNKALLGVTIGTVAVVALYNSSMSVNNLVFQFYFGDAKKSSLAMIASYIPLLLFMPFAGSCVERFGKKKLTVITSLFSTLVGVISFFLPISPDSKGMILYMGTLIFLNIGCSVFQIIVWAMVADCIEKSYRDTGVREEATLYALYSFFRKLSQGIGSAAIALGLGIVGFIENSTTQTMQTALGIKNLYLIFLTVAVLILGISIQVFYSIDIENKSGSSVSLESTSGRKE